MVYAIGRDGIAIKEPDEKGRNLDLLFDTIIQEIPGPSYDPGAPFQLRVSDLSYSDYLGRLAVGKIFNGSAHARDNLVCIGENGEKIPLTGLQTSDL